MNTGISQPYGVARHIARLREEGALLAKAAERAGLAAPVPACPGWQVRDLLKHTGYVHRWAASYVANGHREWVDRASEQEILRDGPGDDELPEWFRAGHGRLVETLAAAGEGLACWTFLPAPSPVAFWARRQAHETTVHRVDGEQAAEAAAGAHAMTPLGPEFAADGIDELLMGFVARDGARGDWQGPQAVVAFHALDVRDAHWRVVSSPGRCEVERGDGPADCVVSGPAADLYLRLWNRGPDSAVTVGGDAGAFDAFRHAARITWT